MINSSLKSSGVLVLISIVASLQTANAGEARCAALGANCLCSEPLDGPEAAYGGILNNSNADPASSDDATECWGRSGYQSFDSDGNQTMAPVTTFGTARYALRQGVGGGFYWLYGLKVSGHEAVAGNQTICWRYYKQVDSDYGSTGAYTGACGPTETWRNKIMSTQLRGQQVQLEEGEGSEVCRIGSSYPITLSVDNGPNSGNYYPTPSVSYDNCKSAPCRIEMCISGNIQNGTNIVYRAKIVPVNTGVESTVTSPTMTSLSGATNYYNWGGDMFHTGGHGGSYVNYFIQAQWNDANVHWIGAACEIEGGCGSDTVAPAPPTGLTVQ